MELVGTVLNASCIYFSFSVQECVRASWSRGDGTVVVLEIKEQRTSASAFFFFFLIHLFLRFNFKKGVGMAQW